jgi:hypothetical protein
MIIKFTCLLAIIFLLSAVEAADNSASKPGNSVSNPSFEKEDPTPGKPYAWNYVIKRGAPFVVWDKKSSNAGKYSVSITNLSRKDCAYVTQVVRCHESTKGKQLKVSAFIKAENIKEQPPAVYLYMNLKDRSIKKMKALVAEKGTYNFKKYENTFLCHKDINSIRIFLWNMGTGTVWYDDVSITIE